MSSFEIQTLEFKMQSIGFREPKTKLSLKKIVNTSSSIKNTNRENIKRVCEILNKFILQPEEEFSFNKFVGKRTTDRGFINGIKNDFNEYVEVELGAGIEHVANMLYTAAIVFDLEIIERTYNNKNNWKNSFLNAYVNYEKEDLKFKNTLSSPIEFVCNYIDGNLLIDVITTEDIKDCVIVMTKFYIPNSNEFAMSSYKLIPTNSLDIYKKTIFENEVYIDIEI